jgi:hypothetical protein
MFSNLDNVDLLPAASATYPMVMKGHSLVTPSTFHFIQDLKVLPREVEMDVEEFRQLAQLQYFVLLYNLNPRAHVLGGLLAASV